MKNIAIILIAISELTNILTPLAYAAESIAPQHPIVAQPTQQQPVNNLLAANTPIKALASSAFSLTEQQRTAGTNYTHTSVRVQKLAKKVYSSDESIAVTVLNPDRDNFKTTVVDSQGNSAPVAIQQSTDGGQTNVQIESSNQFMPGKYTLTVTDEDGTTTKQDFTWGVLAMNPDQSIYQPNQTADIALAVLDDKGDMVCNASVTMEITRPDGKKDTLSTTSGSIVVNPECMSKKFTLTPDYEAKYHLGNVGTYAVKLTSVTGNGTYSITDQLLVQDTVPFVVKRTSATRIYPPLAYPMNFAITANQDFNGTVTETVPASFTITPSDQANSYDKTNTLYLNQQSDPANNISHQVLGASTSSLIMPFDGSYPITQGFGTSLTDVGLRNFYAQYGLGGHDGVDFGVPMGTPLYAVDDGNVLLAGPGDYGNTIIIQHSWGRTYYGHLSIVKVLANTSVRKGSLIGYSGNTGESTGPHLHFGMKPNNPDMNNGFAGKVDPLPYLPISGANSAKLLGLTNAAAVLGASDSATPTPLPSAAPEQNLTGTQPMPALQSTPASNSAVASYTVSDDEIRKTVVDSESPQVEKVKVIKWNVTLKKGRKTTLSYSYQAPQVSPQFYTVGPLKFFDTQAQSLAFQEAREWQIAADAVGVDWYNPSWQYRKSITIDHTKVGSAPPTLDVASAAISGTSVSAISWNHVTTANSNRLLVVGVASSSQTVSTVTYNGSALTKQTTVNCPSACHDELWTLVGANLVSGTKQIVVTMTGSTNIIAGSSTYYNVAQAGTFGTATTASGTSTTATTTVTTTSNQLVVDALGSNSATAHFTTSASQTLLYDNHVASPQGAGSYRTSSGASTAMTWTDTAADTWAIIAIPVNGIPVDQTNFPVLVSLPSDANLGAHAQGSGNDILFTDSTGRVKLSHEIEKYSVASGIGTLIAWVNVPTVSSSSDTIIYMYYGNPTVGSQQSATATWNSNYKAVYHMQTDPSTNCATSVQICDSTTNANNGTMVGGMTSGNLVSGQIGKSISFNGTNQSFTAPDTVSLRAPTSLTLSAWVDFSGSASSFSTVLEKGSADTTDSYGMHFHSTSSNQQTFEYDSPSGTIHDVNETTGSLTTGSWQYETIVVDGVGNTVTFYHNGVQTAAVALPAALVSTLTSPLFIGQQNKSGAGNWWTGDIEEVHIVATALSTGWLTTEFNNQNSPATFSTLGSEETRIYAPTNDRLMRHGKYFDTTGVEQPFVF